jgi:hypothetical protein
MDEFSSWLGTERAKAKPFQYLDNPEMIAAYLNEAFESEDASAIVILDALRPGRTSRDFRAGSKQKSNLAVSDVWPARESRHRCAHGRGQLWGQKRKLPRGPMRSHPDCLIATSVDLISSEES